MPWETLAAPSDTEIAALRRENATKARFLVDESLGEGVAEVLGDQGWNAKFASDVGLKGRSDEDVLGSRFETIACFSRTTTTSSTIDGFQNTEIQELLSCPAEVETNMYW